MALGATITNTVTATSPALAALVTAAASIRIVPPRNDAAWVTPDAGGWLRATDDKVLLRVPPGATAQQRQLCYRSQPAPAGLLAAFALAGDPAGGFDQPAQLWVRRPADAAPRGLDTLRLLACDAGAGDWQALPTTAPAATGSLTTAVYAPGVYAVAGSGLKFYQDPKPIQWVIDDFLRQVARYQQYTDKVKYVFKASVPDAVRAALEAAGVVVEVVL